MARDCIPTIIKMFIQDFGKTVKNMVKALMYFLRLKWDSKEDGMKTNKLKVNGFFLMELLIQANLNIINPMAMENGLLQMEIR